MLQLICQKAGWGGGQTYAEEDAHDEEGVHDGHDGPRERRDDLHHLSALVMAPISEDLHRKSPKQ